MALLAGILAAVAVVVVLFFLGVAKASSRGDEVSEQAVRATLLRGLARRRGQRRRSSRRARSLPVLEERRVAERRVEERRSDPTEVDATVDGKLPLTPASSARSRR